MPRAVSVPCVPDWSTIAVIKLQVLLLASPFLDRSFTAVVAVTLYKALDARGVDGINVAVVPKILNVPETGPPGPFTINEFVDIEGGNNGSSRLNLMLPKAAPAAPFVGLFENTVGGVVSWCGSNWLAGRKARLYAQGVK